MAAFGAACVLSETPVREIHMTWEVYGLALFVTLIFVPVIIDSRTMKSEMDETKGTLIPVRVQSGQSLALLFVIGISLWGGVKGIIAILPAWTAAVGAVLFFLWRHC